MTAKDILIKARACLVKRGWFQGDAMGPNGSVCMLGAIELVRDSASIGGANLAARALSAAIDDRVAPWNDRPGRTFDEVLAAFDKAIANS